MMHSVQLVGQIWELVRHLTDSSIEEYKERVQIPIEHIVNSEQLATCIYLIASRIEMMYVFPNPCEMSNTHTRNIHLHSSLFVRSPYIRLAHTSSLLSHFLARLPSFLLLLTFYRIH